jgi:hypothetical protein
MLSFELKKNTHTFSIMFSFPLNVYGLSFLIDRKHKREKICMLHWHFQEESRRFNQLKEIAQTWKAEEAVPKTKPFGKLALLICDKDVWISKATSTTMRKAMRTPLGSILYCRSFDAEIDLVNNDER